MAYYRLYFSNPRSHGIIRVEEIQAGSDAEATSKSISYAGDCALELWSGARMVRRFDANDVARRPRAGQAMAPGAMGGSQRGPEEGSVE